VLEPRGFYTSCKNRPPTYKIMFGDEERDQARCELVVAWSCMICPVFLKQEVATVAEAQARLILAALMNDHNP